MIKNNFDPMCPHCKHVATDDEMSVFRVDMWAVAPNEYRESIDCHGCGKTLFVKVGYVPTYLTAKSEEGIEYEFEDGD